MTGRVLSFIWICGRNIRTAKQLRMNEIRAKTLRFHREWSDIGHPPRPSALFEIFQKNFLQINIWLCIPPQNLAKNSQTKISNISFFPPFDSIHSKSVSVVGNFSCSFHESSTVVFDFCILKPVSYARAFVKATQKITYSRYTLTPRAQSWVRCSKNVLGGIKRYPESAYNWCSTKPILILSTESESPFNFELLSSVGVLWVTDKHLLFENQWRN